MASQRSRSAAAVWPWLAVGAVCVAAGAGIWLGPGILNTRAGGDSPFLLQRAFELAAALRAGQFPARWMADAAFGLGYPFFHFYAALPYYLAALLDLLGFDLLTAIKLTQTAGLLAAGWGMLLYARTVLPRPGAALAAIAYTLAPFHLVNVYVRGDSLSEFYAFVWYPLILWAVDRVVRREGRRLADILVLAGFAAALIVTHQVSALLFAPMAALYALGRLAWRAAAAKRVAPAGRAAGALALAAVLAAALSAWFWLPALGDAGMVQLGNQTSGYLNYANHFRAADLIQGGLAFDYRVTDEGTPFAMGLAQAILAAAGAVVVIIAAARRRAPPALPAALALALLATFMMTPPSAWLWERVPLLSLAQFPWRYLSVQALFASLLIGGLAGAAAGAPRPRRLAALAILAAGAAVLMLQSLPGLPNERLDIRAEDVTADALKAYEWFSGNIGTTIRAEYLPAAVQPRPLTGPDVLGLLRQARVVAGEIASSALESSNPSRQVWRVRVASEAATFSLPLLYWPAWQARLAGDGTPLALSPHAGTGWVQLSLPRGDQRMELTLGATPNQRAGELVSAAGVAVAVIGVVARAGIRARARARIPARAQIPARAGIQLLGALAVLPSLALAAQLIRALDPPRPPAMQTMDFAGRPFAHRGPITFTGVDGQAYTLTAATVLPARVSAGDPFTVTTAWQDGRAPAEFGVEQELPSGGYFALLFRFARSVSLGDPAVGAHVALPEALPGPLLLKLRARDAQGGWLTPTVASNAFQGGALLDGLRVTAQSQPAPGQALRVFPNGIVLHAVDWIHTTENDLCIRPAWSTNRPQADALKVAWRLRGSDGRDIAGADGEPQAGLAPVWSWPVGATVRDNYCTSLASPLKPGEAYTLQARWYRVSDGRVSGEVILVGERGDALFDLHAPRVAVTRHSRQPPPAQRSSQLAFGGLIRLAGYDVLTSTQALTLTLHWQALGPIPADYKLFVHLSPPQSAEPAAQADQQALGGLYPTGMWQAGEAVSDRVALDWAGLAPGRYRLAVGWYDPDTLQRLPATDAGEPVADGWAVLAEVER